MEESGASYTPYAVYVNTWQSRARIHQSRCAFSVNRFNDPGYGYWLDADTYEGAREAAGELPLQEVLDCFLCMGPER